jgi:hypothetical protein
LLLPLRNATAVIIVAAIVVAITLCAARAESLESAAPRRLRGWGPQAFFTIPEVHTVGGRFPAEISSNYDPICDPQSQNFTANNSAVLDKKKNFTKGPFTLVGLIAAAWDLLTVALAFFTMPKLPVPLASQWKGNHLAKKTDPLLGIAGPMLGRVAMPPRCSPVTANYMRAKMKEPARIWGIRMPWNIYVAILIFFAQALQGVFVAIRAYVFGRMNILWLGLHFPLTFRFEVWVAQLVLITRLLVSYHALRSFIGIDTMFELSWKPPRHTFLDYPWDSVSNHADGYFSASRIIHCIYFFSTFVILPIAGVGMLLFWMAFVVCLLPGAIVALLIRYVYESCNHPAPSAVTPESHNSLQQQLLPKKEEEIDDDDSHDHGLCGHATSLVPGLDDVKALGFIFVFSIFVGYSISHAIEPFASPETYLCPFAHMTIFQMNSSYVNSMGAYFGFILMFIVAAYSCSGLYKLFAGCRHSDVKDPAVLKLENGQAMCLDELVWHSEDDSKTKMISREELEKSGKDAERWICDYPREENKHVGIRLVEKLKNAAQGTDDAEKLKNAAQGTDDATIDTYFTYCIWAKHRIEQAERSSKSESNDEENVGEHPDVGPLEQLVHSLWVLFCLKELEEEKKKAAEEKKQKAGVEAAEANLQDPTAIDDQLERSPSHGSAVI